MNGEGKATGLALRTGPAWKTGLARLIKQRCHEIAAPILYLEIIADDIIALFSLPSYAYDRDTPLTLPARKRKLLAHCRHLHLETPRELAGFRREIPPRLKELPGIRNRITDELDTLAAAYRYLAAQGGFWEFLPKLETFSVSAYVPHRGSYTSIARDMKSCRSLATAWCALYKTLNAPMRCQGMSQNHPYQKSELVALHLRHTVWRNGQYTKQTPTRTMHVDLSTTERYSWPVGYISRNTYKLFLPPSEHCWSLSTILKPIVHHAYDMIEDIVDRRENDDTGPQNAVNITIDIPRNIIDPLECLLAADGTENQQIVRAVGRIMAFYEEMTEDLDQEMDPKQNKWRIAIVEGPQQCPVCMVNGGIEDGLGNADAQASLGWLWQEES